MEIFRNFPEKYEIFRKNFPPHITSHRSTSACNVIWSVSKAMLIWLPLIICNTAVYTWFLPCILKTIPFNRSFQALQSTQCSVECTKAYAHLFFVLWF